MSCKILVDIDDTIENLGIAWCKWLNDLYGLNVKWKDITNWDVKLFFPTLTKEQVFAPLHNEKFWYTVEPKEDAIKYLKKLYDEGYDIYLCTSTDYRAVQMKFETIVCEYFPFIDWQHVIVAHNKQMIKADFLIDDAPHNLIGGKYKKILYTAPHNRAFKTIGTGIKRVNNWEEAYNAVKRHYFK